MRSWLWRCNIFFNLISEFLEQTSTILYQISLIILAIAVIIKLISGKKWSMIILFTGAFLLTVSAIYRDAYMHDWDERYHALVALNSIEEPLTPALYKDTLLSTRDHSGWYVTHIWLHKPPFFTWQMAFFMKLLGKDLVGMRMASAFMVLLFGVVLYYSTQRYYPRAAFWVTLIGMTNPYLLLLISGRRGMDHNDIAFITWTTVSFAAWLMYIQNPKRTGYIFLIGIAAAFAILTKWLAGSFIFFIWGLYMIINREFQLREVRNLLLSVITATALVLPWQIHTMSRFRELAVAEWEYNRKHIFEVIEGHDHSLLFHFEVWRDYFPLASVLFLCGILLLIFKPPQLRLLITLLLSVCAVMVFYSLAKTGLPSYTVFIFPLVLFIGAFFLNTILTGANQWILGPLIIFGAFLEFRNQYLHHMQDPQYVEHHKKIREIGLKLKSLPQNTVILNTKPMEFTEMMFYSEKIAYENIPSLDEVNELREKGYKPVILKTPSDTIPDDIASVAKIIEIPDY